MQTARLYKHQREQARVVSRVYTPCDLINQDWRLMFRSIKWWKYPVDDISLIRFPHVRLFLATIRTGKQLAI